jgi:uncharacterized membrane protein YfcA
MVEQYKKTFVATQLAILVVTGGVMAWSRAFGLALTFFVAMQLGAVVGAAWATRLRAKVLAAPLRPNLQTSRP